jgi:hypothetical protein
MAYLFGSASGGGGGGGGAVTAQERLKGDAITTLLSSELNTLATATGSSLGTEYDNTLTTTGNMWADFELFAAFAAATNADSTVDLYIVPAPDGTNYCDGGVAVQPVNFFRGSWSLRATTSYRLVVHQVALPPTKFKIFVVNNSGQAMSASGNTVRMVGYREQLGT